MCLVENEDVVGAAPTGDAPTTSEWSTILLSTKVRLILETWRYIHHMWRRFSLARTSAIGRKLNMRSNLEMKPLIYTILSSTFIPLLEYDNRYQSYNSIVMRFNESMGSMKWDDGIFNCSKDSTTYHRPLWIKTVLWVWAWGKAFVAKEF